MDELKWLMHWYKSNCDHDWEHVYGVTIKSLDNPGWHIEIDLNDTPLQDKTFPEFEKDNGENDWIFCKVSNNIFEGSGDPMKLGETITEFKKWAESCGVLMVSE
jgi:hypothetical protein